MSRLDTGVAVIRQSGLTATSITPSTDWLVGKTYRIWVRAISTTGTISVWSQFVDLKVASVNEPYQEELLSLAVDQELVTALQMFPKQRRSTERADHSGVPAEENQPERRFTQNTVSSTVKMHAPETRPGELTQSAEFPTEVLIDEVMSAWLETSEL